MKMSHRIQYLFAILLTLAAVTPSDALETNQTVDAALNVIATNAFRILHDVPNVGLEQSAAGLEQIIETHRRLSRETDLSQRQLSLVLADRVAYAIVTEIHRSETARLGADPRMTPKSISFDKKTALRLWKANMPDFPVAIRKALQGHDTVIGFVSKHSSEEAVLSGKMIDKAPLNTILPRIRELHNKAMYNPVAVGKSPSPDEQLIYALAKYQAFLDLDTIINLYEKSILPSDSASLRTSIEGELKPSVGKRVDDGMEVTAFKVWLTFGYYHPEGTSQNPVAPIEEYYFKQALSLAPFMTDTSSLPETAKKALAKMGGAAALLQQ